MHEKMVFDMGGQVGGLVSDRTVRSIVREAVADNRENAPHSGPS